VPAARSTIRLDPEVGTSALFSTFSRILGASADRRAVVLSEIERIVADELGGRVERPCVTILHHARRS
jgi:hypothetical protein